MSEEVYEFRNIDGSVIKVSPHDTHARDLDARAKVMMDLLMYDMDHARYNEYRAVMTLKLYTKCLMHNRDDLAEMLGNTISAFMTRKIASPKEDGNDGVVYTGTEGREDNRSL
jgi:hypothetical protein